MSKNGPTPFRTQSQRKAGAQSQARHERDNELARLRIKLRAFEALVKAVDVVLILAPPNMDGRTGRIEGLNADAICTPLDTLRAARATLTRSQGDG